jgi:predicted Holliday junction resolvase-like endonuclease
MNSVSEKIDERILRLLGLEDIFDLDYDTYMTLLKEAIVVGKDKIPQEELALLANERKRIRGKTGRFKAKKEKITVDKNSALKFIKPSKNISAFSKSISKSDVSQNLDSVIGPLQSIEKTLAEILKFNKKTNEEERKDKESQKRTKREESLEGFKKGISAVSGAAKKMLAPFQSIIDRIWKFIFFTLLGRAFTQLMDWLGDPANKRKIEVLGRFLKDWWPALAFAAGLFLTPFGKFVRTTIGALRTFLPQMLVLLKNPAFLAVTGSAAAGVAGASLESNLKKVDETLLQRKIKEAKDQGKPLSKQEIEKIKLEQLQKRIQDVRGTNIPGSALLASGGIVPRFSMGGINPSGNYMNGLFDTGYEGIDNKTGQRVSGFGPDTQAIIAQPGEIVINKKTVDAMGPGYFLGLNRTYGGPGANKPKMGKLYNTGGIVGMQGGGSTKVRAENPRMSPRGTEFSLGSQTTTYSLLKSIQDAKQRLLDRDALTNTNIRHTGIRPWWERINPFADKRGFADRLPSHDPSMKNYNMPGYNRNRWFELNNFRTRPEEYKSTPNPKQKEKLRYASPTYVRPGIDKPLALQGGGLIGGLDSFGRSVFENVGGSVGKNKGRETGLPGGGWFGEKLGERKGRDMYEKLTNPLKRRGGGLIKENTGMDIPGATADRQLAMLQPGEYILPAGTVSKLGVPLIDMMVAMTDYDSTPAKLGKKPINRPTITPPSRMGRGGIITLPPITQSAGGSMMGGTAAGSKVPSFSAVSPSAGEERSNNARIYGIVG